MIVDFWADWCAWCHRLDKNTYADPWVARKAQEFVAVKVNTEGSRKELDVAVRYHVTSLPTIVFLSPEGRQLFRLNGYQGPGQFPRTLEGALQAARTVMSWEDALARDPDDPRALLALGSHLFEQEYFDEARDLLQKAVARDVEAELDERRRARMLLAIIEHVTRNFGEAERLVKEALSLEAGPGGPAEAPLRARADLLLLGPSGRGCRDLRGDRARVPAEPGRRQGARVARQPPPALNRHSPWRPAVTGGGLRIRGGSRVPPGSTGGDATRVGALGSPPLPVASRGGQELQEQSGDLLRLLLLRDVATARDHDLARARNSGHEAVGVGEGNPAVVVSPEDESRRLDAGQRLHDQGLRLPERGAERADRGKRAGAEGGRRGTPRGAPG